MVTKRPVTVDNEGVHILGGRVPFVRRESGSCCFATRLTDPRIANAVSVPGRQQCININYLHVALVHSYAGTLRETARQRGVKVVGELVPCAGCSAAKGRRMPVPRSTNSRSTKSLERLVIDLSGKRPTSSGDHQYRLMIVDGFFRFGWTYFLKEKSDVPAVFAGFLADMRARGTPSIVECLRSDNGTEFTKGEFVALLNHRSIGREYTPVDSELRRRGRAQDCSSLGGRDGVLPVGPPSVRWRASAADRASLGRSVHARELCHQRVSEGEWQPGQAVTVSEAVR